MTIEKLFTVLQDGAWHSVTELAEQTGTETNKLIEYSQFLAEQGMAKYEDKTQKIKIEPEWSQLLPNETELTEPEKPPRQRSSSHPNQASTFTPRASSTPVTSNGRQPRKSTTPHTQ